MLSELRGEGEAHLPVIHNGRRLKRIVQPGEQVAIDEQLLAEQCDEIGQAPCVRALQLKVLDQQHRNQSRPDLRLDRILARLWQTTSQTEFAAICEGRRDGTINPPDPLKWAANILTDLDITPTKEASGAMAAGLDAAFRYAQFLGTTLA